jgi:MYXO-CTERM domain-containing protein
MATCSKKAPWDRDGSVPPPGIQYDCVKCVAPATDGGTVDASDVSGTGGNSGSGGTTGGTGGTVAVDAPLHPLGAKREPDGCSVSGTQAGRALGPWLMAGAAALMVSLTRRRRRG